MELTYIKTYLLCTWLLVSVADSAFGQQSSDKDGATLKSYNQLLPTPDDQEIANSPTNIILLIGDGMGLSQISSAFYYQETTPHYARFNDLGLIRTSSTVKITDSAAGATAFASGEKSYNGAIGVDADTVSIPTIVELLSAKDWKTGVISTSSITHATPACFYSHVKSRSMDDEIAAQLATSEIDFFAGGGVGYFTDSLRRDGKDYLKILKENGFNLRTDKLDKNTDVDQKHGYLLGHPALPTMLNGRGNYLTDATSLALEYFTKSKAPFFLMVEGSMIDWGGHANNAPYLISEMIDFDNTIGLALDYAEEHGNTLVIVTADHETGGFTLSSGSNYDEVVGTFSTGGHSTSLIPVAAYGPGSELFRGIYENTRIFHKMVKAIGLQQTN